MYSVLDLQKLVQMLSFLGISPGSGSPPHSVVLGGGTNAAPGAAGTLLGSNGPTVDPSFLSLASLGIQPLLGYTPAHSGANSDITSMSALTSAPSLQYTIAGTGAVARTMTAGMQDYPTVRDFGAVANATTDDSAAVIAALTAYNSPIISNGGYAIKAALPIGSGQTIVAEPGADLIYSGSGTISLNGNGNYISYKEGADHDTWYWGRNRTGTHSTNVGTTNLGYGGAAFNFEVHRDDMNLGTDFSRALYVRHIFGGSGAQGGRIGMLGEVYHQAAPTNASNGQRNYVGAAGYMHAQAPGGDGGSSTSFSGALGAYFGLNAIAYADTGVTNILGLVGMEIDTYSAAGTTAAYHCALNLVNFDQMTGAQLDAALVIGAGADPTYGTGLGWPMGICFSDLNGNANPMRTNATLIGYTWAKSAGQRTVLDGINFSGFTFAGNIVQSQYAQWNESATVIGFGGKGAQVINLLGSSTTTTAPGAGGAGALPATPRGYYNMQINGTAVQIAFY